MILYTMMPAEIIFQQESEVYNQQKMVVIDGVNLLVNETTTNNYQISRVISTDPQHFLRSEVAPGNILSKDRTNVLF
ncbi:MULTISPECIES: YlzJ-like family protein [Bacillaceae]|uniref:YlzJ-like family protein n=1 Tax=Bacillaceae TaxID=186817 RepID=UPI002A15CA4B|nr:YlzJ-like family protein [Cytobacillus sp. IB215316]MDX8362191.1 YlzJ-like family protein [Cytobacillus sp. IB215316]